MIGLESSLIQGEGGGRRGQVKSVIAERFQSRRGNILAWWGEMLVRLLDSPVHICLRFVFAGGRMDFGKIGPGRNR